MIGVMKWVLRKLKHIANLISHSVRKLDIACRYGGEEFVIILPGMGILIVKQVAERIRWRFPAIL